MWHPLLRANRPRDLIGDRATRRARPAGKHKAEVERLVEAWTSQRTKHEAMKILAEAGVPSGALPRHRRGLADPHCVPATDRRGRHTRARALLTVGNPVKLSASPTKITPAPLLGEHRREILAELGYSPADIESFEAGGRDLACQRRPPRNPPKLPPPQLRPPPKSPPRGPSLRLHPTATAAAIQPPPPELPPPPLLPRPPKPLESLLLLAPPSHLIRIPIR
jgi:hypothetical protein